MNNRKNLNFVTLAIFAPVLILAGVAGFIVPAQQSLTSGAAPYNIFHLVFGLVGLIIVLSGNVARCHEFNIIFGLIDLYQAIASFGNFFPQAQFKWTRVDDLLHIVIGAALVLIGIFGS